jgi:hypothetical protein
MMDDAINDYFVQTVSSTQGADNTAYFVESTANLDLGVGSFLNSKREFNVKKGGWPGSTGYVQIFRLLGQGQLVRTRRHAIGRNPASPPLPIETVVSR